MVRATGSLRSASLVASDLRGARMLSRLWMMLLRSFLSFSWWWLRSEMRLRMHWKKGMRRSPELSPEKEIGEGFEKGREFSAAMQMHLHRVYEIDTQKTVFSHKFCTFF